MDYINYVAKKLNTIKIDLGIKEDIVVADEQVFEKLGKQNNAIYVVIKKLSSSISYDGIVQPVQLMVLSEANSLVNAQALMNKFATDLNLVAEMVGSDLIKQTYDTPVVVGNFNSVGSRFASLLYVNGTLFILESIVDMTRLNINGVDLKVSSFNFVYAMTGNTQPVSGNKISTTVKSVSTVNCSFVIPMISSYNSLIKKILEITNGTESGDYGFNFVFYVASNLDGTIYNYSTDDIYDVGDLAVYNSIVYRCKVDITEGETFNPAHWDYVGVKYSFTMKLVSANFTTAPNAAPGLQLGFMV